MEVQIKKMENIEEKKDQLEKELQQSDEKLQKLIEGIAYIITEIVEIRDPYLRGHHQRVSKLATAIAQEMKLPQDKIEGVKIASLVHDVGKVNLPTEIISCLLYTSDAADEEDSVDLGGRRIIKKKKKKKKHRR